jgi:DNA primase
MIAEATATKTEAPKTEIIEAEVTDTEVIIHQDDRRYRIRGLEKNLSLARLHVNLKVDRLDAMHINSFDLYSDRHRAGFIKRASEELYIDEDIVKRDIARVLRKLEELQSKKAEQATSKADKPVELTEKEHGAAMQLLEDPNLLNRILSDYDKCGLVGEETNKLVCYLACVSRRLQRPLAVLIQSSSAAGKTTLMDAALAFMPLEDQIKYSAMTGQSLYYMGGTNLKHKILAIAEEEGVSQASYALKLLQSEGKLMLASTGKDSDSGRQQTQCYEVEGPVMMFLTTTAENPDPELQNRCITLRVNETPEQTAAIHQRQRSEYAQDVKCVDREAICTLHQNAQRLLKPLKVIIPWSEQLTFRSDQTRMRRDHVKYLSLIASLTLLHQHQRERTVRQRDGHDEACVIATKEDIEVAGRLASEAMGKSLDSLMPQTRQLLVLLDDYVAQRATAEKALRPALRFTQRQLRETFGWSDRQLRRHLQRLVELEYVLPYRTGQRNGREYALLYDGQGREGEPFLLGLLDAAKLRKRQTGGSKSQTGGQKRQSAPRAAGNRRPTGGTSASPKNGVSRSVKKTSKRRPAKQA